LIAALSVGHWQSAASPEVVLVFGQYFVLVGVVLVDAQFGGLGGGGVRAAAVERHDPARPATRNASSTARDYGRTVARADQPGRVCCFDRVLIRAAAIGRPAHRP
jgi:hypothetical protein